MEDQDTTPAEADTAMKEPDSAVTKQEVDAHPESISPEAQQPEETLSVAQKMRQDVGHQAGILWFFEVFTSLFQLVIGLCFFGFSLSTLDKLGKSGWVMLFSEILAVIVVMLWTKRLMMVTGAYHRKLSCAVRFRSRKPMTIFGFLLCFVLFFAISEVGEVIGDGILSGVKAMGLQPSTTLTAIDSITNGSLGGLLFVGVTGPIVEEILFRGIVMDNLEHYGRWFAIVTSATLFGFFHGDIPQGFSAFLGGLLLGYVASEYSVVWSAVFHIVNNLVFSTGLGKLTDMLSGSQQNILDIIMAVFSVVVLVVLAISQRQHIVEWREAHRTAPHAYLGWESPLFVATLVLFAIPAVVNLI
ncbi:type II CAAX endopeptidase family protein [Bifidobacterium sp. ESL0745]|uniref:CPBP family intramembrane glutamic endopeptidase n=1 Tax=Bifidobacterium sp. ESL0745 TaxID=2983226 RepID=UPI0023F84CBC|nr:type II CAAX endopeptidase family protein [Bifidobacterium sp. ESL0745]MDF7665118.1 type II CAAX endopeptidase family protein [Bifidobacterium sp. ESL0745]